MIIQEFRPIDARGKSEVEKFQSCRKDIATIVTQVNPKEHQCISMDGYIVFEGHYDPNGIVTYKIPRGNTDYEFDRFPEEYHKEVQILQQELSLTKKQVTTLYKTVKSFDIQINSFEKRLELLREGAKHLKNNDNQKKYINNFYKAYEKFTEFLTKDLASYDIDKKIKIKKELLKLINLIDDVIQNHLT